VNNIPALDARRAIEALRAGVPNGQAVRFLKAGQDRIMRRFEAGLESLRPGSSGASKGFILGGEFGTGKSHQLERLKQEALRRGFAASRVNISKETPLSDLDLVYKDAVKALELPDRRGGDLNEVVLRLDLKSADYAAFRDSVSSPSGGFDPLFAATLLVNGRLGPGEDYLEQIASFWAGGRINISELKKQMRLAKSSALNIKPRKYPELAPERFVFAAGLIRAAGYKGWVILLDEIELVAKFPILGRAKSYVNLMWLLGYAKTNMANAYCVAAATREFTGEIIDQKQDNVKIPLSVAKKHPQLAELAAAALKQIPESGGAWERIEPLSEGDLDRVYRDVRELYRLAFNWESREAQRPDDAALPRSMRTHMREWITRWDLERLDPSYRADIESELLRPDLAEGAGLEGLSEADPADTEEDPAQSPDSASLAG
jgi:hypothetical protein